MWQVPRIQLIVALSLTTSATCALRPLAFLVNSQRRGCTISSISSNYNTQERVQRSSLHAGDTEDLNELYKTVAEQDPEWYREFVMNVLGESAPALDTLVADISAPVKATETVPNEVELELELDDEPADSESIVPGEALVAAVLINETTATAAETPPLVIQLVDVTAVEDDATGNDADDEPQIQMQIPQSRSEKSDVGIDQPGESTDNADTEIAVKSAMDAIRQANQAMTEGAGSAKEMEEIQAMSTAALEALGSGEEILRLEEGGPSEPSDTLAEQVVLYRDFYKNGRFRSVPLNALTSLGYTVDEIPYLQLDVLSLIIEDSIEKPTRGIPPQWKISPSQYKVLMDDVRIMPSTAAKALLEQSRKKPRTVAQNDVILSEEEQGPPRETPRRRRHQVSGEEEEDASARRRQQRPSAPRSDEDEMPPPRSIRSQQQRQQQQEEEEEEISQNRRRRGRPNPAPRRSPPSRSDPPQNPVWMDIDTFRDLLRKEAELRVRILGEGWSDTVKRESSWRLRLYKEWLWNLHDGVGEPLFQSQSERERRRVKRASGDVPPPRTRGRSDPQKRIMDPRGKIPQRPSQDGDDDDNYRPRRSQRRDVDDD
jgi:hypothetical protein